MRNWASERLSHLAKVTWPISLVELDSGPSLSLSPDSELSSIAQVVPFSRTPPSTALALSICLDQGRRSALSIHPLPSTDGSPGCQGSEPWLRALPPSLGTHVKPP